MHKLTAVLVVVVALTLPATLIAQAGESPNVPDRTDVLKLLELMHARIQMKQTIDGVTKQMRLGAEAGFKLKVPNATPEQLAKVDKLFNGIFDDLPLDEMVDAIVPIYQKHLTKADLEALTQFYGSPVGQKILNEMPAILSESMEAGGQIGQRMFAAKSAEFDKRVAELIESSTPDKTPIK
jgi:hypothetical protein